jgi:uncharacterized protein (TIGR02145 family)
MKKFYLIIVCSVLLIQAKAQNDAAIEIQKKDNSVIQYKLTGVDSVTFTTCKTIPNNAPDKPQIVFPLNGSTDQPKASTLSWTCTDPEKDPLTYDIYFGTSTPPQLLKSFSGIATFNPGNLYYKATYYWKIVARDNHHNITEGDIWSFTTVANQPPAKPVYINPQKDTTNQDIALTLKWACTDPENDDIRYDIYFGTVTNPPLLASGIYNKIYNVSSLSYSTKYYWKIVANDLYSNITAGDVWSFTTGSQISLSGCKGMTSFVYEGQTYNTVEINKQCWMKENLNTGTMINGSVDQSNNGITEKYCYGNDTNNCIKYGGLYQWNELMQYTTAEKTRGLCPPGWYIPSDAEWFAMENYIDLFITDPLKTGLRGNFGGGKLKETGTVNWQTPNTGATNIYGFTALPAGFRNMLAAFVSVTSTSYFWTSTINTNKAWERGLFYYTGQISRDLSAFTNGFSVRCLKD